MRFHHILFICNALFTTSLHGSYIFYILPTKNQDLFGLQNIPPSPAAKKYLCTIRSPFGSNEVKIKEF